MTHPQVIKTGPTLHLESSALDKDAGLCKDQKRDAVLRTRRQQAFFLNNTLQFVKCYKNKNYRGQIV